VSPAIIHRSDNDPWDDSIVTIVSKHINFDQKIAFKRKKVDSMFIVKEEARILKLSQHFPIKIVAIVIV
jgi:hypothetical protein